jgi:hypothetical protein
MIYIVSVPFNIGANTVDKGEKICTITNDQTEPPLDSSTRKLSPFLIASYFI